MITEAVVSKSQPKRTTHQWTDDEVKSMHKLIRSDSVWEVASRFGVSPNALAHKLSRTGVRFRTGGGLSNIAEIARRRNLSQSTLLNYVAEGIIPATRVGPIWQIKPGEDAKVQQAEETRQKDRKEGCCQNCQGNLPSGLNYYCSRFCQTEFSQIMYWESIFGFEGSDRTFEPYFRRSTQNFLAIEGVDLMDREAIYLTKGKLSHKPNKDEPTQLEQMFERILTEFPGFVVPKAYMKSRLYPERYYPYKIDVESIYKGLKSKLTDSESIFAAGEIGWAIGVAKFEITEPELKLLRQLQLREGTFINGGRICRNLGLPKTRDSMLRLIDVSRMLDNRLSVGGEYRIIELEKGELWKGGYSFRLQRT